MVINRLALIVGGVHLSAGRVRTLADSQVSRIVERSDTLFHQYGSAFPGRSLCAPVTFGLRSL